MYLAHRLYLLNTRNIYRALAFESSILESFNLKENNFILFWISGPSVVIGRHQNPWSETNPSFLKSNNIALARRASGGGAVYHDVGNLNISFITDGTSCNRPVNMKIISGALNKGWNLQSVVGKRDELFVQDSLKVSGSSSRYGRSGAYHHCTLLLRSDLGKQSLCLRPVLNIETTATRSVRSAVTNLHIDHMSIVDAVRLEYSQIKNCPVPSIVEVEEGRESAFVDPDAFERHLCQFESHDWIYKRSPAFQIKKSFVVRERTFELGIHCRRSVIESITVSEEGFFDGAVLTTLNEVMVGAELGQEDLRGRSTLYRAKLEPIFPQDCLVLMEALEDVIRHI